ncbi:glycoside hydrolase [Mycena vitilis]|nr:glycoside hydrolase [Mycena vitilis]
MHRQLLLAVFVGGPRLVAAQNSDRNGTNSKSSAVAGVLITFAILLLLCCGVKCRLNRTAPTPLARPIAPSYFPRPRASPNHYTNPGNSGIMSPLPWRPLPPRSPALPPSDSEYPSAAAADYTPPPYVKDGGDAVVYDPPGLYILRPEVLESNFYAYRVTGDTKYLDRAASAIDAFNKYLLAPDGAYAGITDVNNAANHGGWGIMESFWFAEVLKYLYLTFDDPEHISVDEYVFNTECQPFKAPPALDAYNGSGGLLPAKPFTVHEGAKFWAAAAPVPSGLTLLR